jgi:hypothetical protein
VFNKNFLGGKVRMYASIVLIALTGSAVASTPNAPIWVDSYDQARQTGITENKPLAVIFGSGEGGYARVCREGKLGADVEKLLAESYVCLYVDLNTAAGKKLASDFAISRDTGMVLSDRSGKVQAFYHDGDLSAADLSKWITRFADPNTAIRTTMTNESSTQVSWYPPAGYSTGYAPGGYYGGFGPSWGGGGCVGGR